MTGPTGLEQQHLVARVCRQPVRDGRTGRTGADNNVIVGLHVLLPALSLDAFYSGTMPRGDQARGRDHGMTETLQHRRDLLAKARKPSCVIERNCSSLGVTAS